MSSHRSEKPLKQAAAAKKTQARSAGVDGEPTPSQKAAFGKAMYEGVKPGARTARQIAQEKAGQDGGADKNQGAAGSPARKVEILRKIAAAAAPVETPDTARALQLAAEIDKAIQVGDFERFQPEAQQALIGALCRLYSANNEMGNHFGAVGQRSAVTATDVMILCGALLKAVDLQVFELGLWQSWSSR